MENLAFLKKWSYFDLIHKFERFAGPVISGGSHRFP